MIAMVQVTRKGSILLLQSQESGNRQGSKPYIRYRDGHMYDFARLIRTMIDIFAGSGPRAPSTGTGALNQLKGGMPFAGHRVPSKVSILCRSSYACPLSLVHPRRRPKYSHPTQPYVAGWLHARIPSYRRTTLP